MSGRQTADIVADLRANEREWLRREAVDLPLDREAADRLAELDAEATEARESANRWAYKTTLLAGWIMANCTTEQAAAARAASQVTS